MIFIDRSHEIPYAETQPSQRGSMRLLNGIVARDYGDVIVAHDRSGHRFFRFEGVASDITRGLAAGSTEAQILAAL